MQNYKLLVHEIEAVSIMDDGHVHRLFAVCKSCNKRQLLGGGGNTRIYKLIDNPPNYTKCKHCGEDLQIEDTITDKR